MTEEGEDGSGRLERHRKSTKEIMSRKNNVIARVTM